MLQLNILFLGLSQCNLIVLVMEGRNFIILDFIPSLDLVIILAETVVYTAFLSLIFGLCQLVSTVDQLFRKL